MSNTLGSEESIEERVATYISMVEKALSTFKLLDRGVSSKAKEIVNLARLYLEDSKYYLDKGDPVTALATISYAEGLLDALARLELARVEWDRSPRPRVVAAGTFDIIHPGHIIMLKEAAKYGDLYVIVSRDKNAKSFKKRPTIFPENARVFIVDNLKPVKKAVLGDPDDILRKVVELRPQIVFLGPDQSVSEEWVKKELEKRGLRDITVLRMPARVSDYKPSSSSQVIKNIIRMFCPSPCMSEEHTF